MAKKEFDNLGNARIRCEVCGEYFHQLPVHLKKHSVTVDSYQVNYPGAPIISEYARERMANAKLGKSNAPTPTAATPGAANALYFGKASMEIRENLTEDDEKYVPEHDAHYKFWNKEALEAVATAMELDLNLLMAGPTGCGKTSLVVELAALLNTPIQRINLDGDVRSSDFLGQMVLTVDPATKQTVTAWEDGVLPRAMRQGHWLILDEMDAAPPQILMTCQAVLEAGHRLVIKENGGEVVQAHPDFRIVATANTLGHGDQTGMYAGTNVLNEATLDRFGIVIRYGYPGVQQEASIVKAKSGVTADMAKDMCTIAKKVRAGVENDECFCTFSTRKLINWGVIAVKLGDAHRAAQYTVLQRLSTEDRQYVAGIIQRVLGTAA